MKTDIVSLKNIYRFLTDNDYPTAFSPVFSQSSLKGLTLTSFWRAMILPEIKENVVGKMIFRFEGKRSRYFSQFCNRSEDIPIYKRFADELDAVLTVDSIKRQNGIVATFLRSHEFDYDTFARKSVAYLNEIKKTDPVVVRSKNLSEYLTWLMSGTGMIQGMDMIERSGYSAIVIVTMMLVSMYGEELNSGFREKRIVGMLRAVCNDSLKVVEKKGDKLATRSVVTISNRFSHLWADSGCKNGFFGREKEMFDLIEYVKIGGKYLITGQSGIGKSELMRQLLKKVIAGTMADAIATVSYRTSISDSLLDAFRWVTVEPGLTPQSGSVRLSYGTSSIERLNDILAYLRSFESKKLIIFMDDVDGSFARDPFYETFFSLPATVVIASKSGRFDGYETYRIEPLSPEACSLMFRSEFRRVLTPDERIKVEKFFTDPSKRHTNSIKLITRMGVEQKWTIDDMINRSEPLTLKNLREIYSDIYSLAGLSDVEKKLLEFISWCPARTVGAHFVAEYTDTGSITNRECFDILDSLAEKGWMISEGNFVSVSLIVSECVKSKSDKHQTFEWFIRRMKREWVGMVDDESMLFDEASGKLVDEQRLMMVDTVIFYYCDTEDISELDRKDRYLFAMAAYIKTSNCNRLDDKTLSLLKQLASDPDESKSMRSFYLLSVIASADYEVIRMEECSDIVTNGREYGIPSELLNDFTIKLVYCCYMNGDVPLMGTYSQKLLENTEGEEGRMRAVAYAYRASYELSVFKYEEAAELIEKGIPLAQDIDVLAELTLLKASYCAVFHQYGEEEKILNSFMEKIEKSGIGFRYDVISEIRLKQGALHRAMGEAENSIIYFKEALEQKKFCYGKESMAYKSALAELANAYEKSGHYEESEAAYIEALRFFDKDPSLRAIGSVLKNNLSVLYLKEKEPKMALKVLKEAEGPLSEMGGICFGEVMNNKSKAYHLLGDNENALECAEKAYPLLLAYGENDPKVVENRALVESIREQSMNKK